MSECNDERPAAHRSIKRKRPATVPQFPRRVPESEDAGKGSITARLANAHSNHFVIQIAAVCATTSHSSPLKPRTPETICKSFWSGDCPRCSRRAHADFISPDRRQHRAGGTRPTGPTKCVSALPSAITSDIISKCRQRTAFSAYAPS
jgi:16S rRNA A1518/A1519 N6-dimethyltransferase RsmA/KsgA/DIM1 with predicted DNA glycosylase/AP lyase activity